MPAGGDLQAALVAAQPGDVIELEAGARFVGQFRLPAKSGSVTLRSSGLLPERRITPADAPALATIVSPGGYMAIDGYDTANWVVSGVRFEPNPTGAGEIIGLWRAVNVTLDRILIEVPDGAQQKRAVLGNGRHVTLTRSHIAGVWREGQDSQAFAAWDGAGPYTITDNYLEAASENVLFGGAGSSADAEVPADILVEGNHFSKPLAWKGLPRQVKCLLELKSARRVTIRNNLFERNWADAQAGRAILFTVRNQDGDAPWSVIEDVLFERNTLREIERGFNLLGYDNYSPSGQMTRVTIRDNYIETEAQAFLVGGEVGRLEIYRNQVVIPGGGVLLSLYGGTVWPAAEPAARTAAWAVLDLVLAENAAPGTYIHSDVAIGEAALQAYARAYSLTLPAGDPPPPAPDPIADTEAPVVTVFQVTRDGKSHNYTVYAEATDNVGVLSLVCTVNGVPADWQFSARKRGTYVVRVTATDAAGLAAVAEQTIVR